VTSPLQDPVRDTEIVLGRAGLAERVQRLGDALAHDHPDGVVLVGVLKGALVFLSDLARAIDRAPTPCEVTIDFLAISRYAPDSGRVRILKDLDLDLTGRDVVVVEDLVDTGLTLAYLLEQLRERGARRVEVCTLLDRPERRIVPITPRYVGEEIAGGAFVVGYGLHVGERYRNLPVIVRVDAQTVTDDPDAYLALYRHPSSAPPLPADPPPTTPADDRPKGSR